MKLLFMNQKLIQMKVPLILCLNKMKNKNNTLPDIDILHNQPTTPTRIYQTQMKLYIYICIETSCSIIVHFCIKL